MTISYKGKADCYMNPSTDSTSVTSRAHSEFFVNIIKLFSASGPGLGIEMIAGNYGQGAGSVGAGWNYWNEGDHPGQRAWACYRFHSASYGKFDFLVYVVSGSSLSSAPMNIGGSAVSPLLGYSFAAHPSGSNVTLTDGPWNGDHTIGSASIGNPVWKTTSSGSLVVFPRPNGYLGTYSASRNYMLRDNAAGGTAPVRQHMLLTQDSFTMLSDWTIDSEYMIMHFGPLLLRSGVNAEAPYFMYSNGNSSAPIQTYTSILGTLAGSANMDGGVAHPKLVSGSKFAAAVIPTADSTISYNAFISTGSFEKYPIWMAIKEAEAQGILGTLKHLAVGYGMPTMGVSTLSSSAAFGSTTLSAIKVIVPWSGSAPNTTTLTRGGRTMDFDV